MATSLWIGKTDKGSKSLLDWSVLSADRRVSKRRRDRRPHERVAWLEWEQPSGESTGDRQDAHNLGVRAFTLWQDQEQREVLARVVTVSASRKQGAEYELRDADGRTLAVIRREAGSLIRLRRSRWSVRQIDQPGRPPAVGRRGRILWWLCWLPLFLLQIVLLIITLGNLAFFGAGSPRRTRLRSGGRVVLDYHGKNRDLEVLGDGWDPRVTAAVIALLDTWDRLLSELVPQRSHP